MGYCLFVLRYSRTSIQIDDSAPHFLFTHNRRIGAATARERMMNIKRISACLIALAFVVQTSAQQVDFSVVTVPEESGIDFTQISTASDYVCMPIVKRSSKGLQWFTNRILDVSKDGKHIAYLSLRNATSNIFVKELGKQGGSTQRTNRQAVIDFSYSPDGEWICFSEQRGKTHQVFRTSAKQGYICRQITSANNDYSPIYTADMAQIFFARQEANSISIWGYDVGNNFLSSYTMGMNPWPLSNEPAILCTRTGSDGRSEIWKINYSTGVEECLISDPNRSFASPCVSPDGEWMLFVGESIAGNDSFTYRNTDLYVARLDGTMLSQLTYHAADDLSPMWSKDSRYIYFVSQRGSAEATANIWRMTFPYTLNNY